MTCEHIYTFLTRAIVELGLEGIDQSCVLRPNVDNNIEDKDLVFELSCSDLEPVQVTERTSQTECFASIVISVNVDEGYKRIDRIAEALVDMFGNYNPRRLQGFDEQDVLFKNGFHKKRSVVYVVGSSRTQPGADEGRFKITVKVNLKILED